MSDLREIDILDIASGGRVTREIKEAQNVKVFGVVKKRRNAKLAIFRAGR